ncbi:amino acid adenylation domain-containing protein, partial [Aduncisulcus paluster]
MPIVFTSGLGMSSWDQDMSFGKLSYNISQTPQVWIDHQVLEVDGGLLLSWDALDELFP